MFKPFNAKIVSIITNTLNTKSFVINTDVNNSNINIEPGQFITLSWIINGREIRRSYSISKYYRKSHHEIQFTVKRIENGLISRYLHDEVQVGDSVMVENIGGLFTLPKEINDFNQIYFVVAGSGIAPVIPMIEYILANIPQLHIQLIYSNKNQHETIFFDLINQYQETYPNQLNVIYLFSENDDILFSRLNNSLLTKLLHQTKKVDVSKILCYTCGPVDYMDTVIITLLTEGVPKNNIRKELFHTDEALIAAIPPDTTTRNVKIIFQNGQTYQFEVQYPTSILNKALELGLRMPYSCGSGQCSTCTAKCVSGKVWMSYNEVLTDAELSKGLILTCTGFPINGDVILEY